MRSFIESLDQKNELIRIKKYVNPQLEIAEIADRFMKSDNGGKALLFENTGTDFPLLINAYGSEKRMCMALNIEDFDELPLMINKVLSLLDKGANSGLFKKLALIPALGKMASWMPKKIKGKGSCQQIIHKNPSLDILPVLKSWPADGGKFITLPLVHTKNPNTESPNMGMYRMQIFDSKTTGMHWHRHKTGANHFRMYQDRKEIMPVAVSLGGDPSYTYSATAPLPENVDELILAGFLRKKAVKLVKCQTQDIWVPEDADVIIEGYIDPQEEPVWEGPFGDHTGFYSLADWYPRFHVTCISHKKDAVYPATIVGIPPMEDAWIAKATEKLFIEPIKKTMIPELVDLHMPDVGVAHNLVFLSIKRSYPGQVQKVINTVYGAGQMMFSKVVVVFDQDVDLRDYKSLMKTSLERFVPDRDCYFSEGPADVLEHAGNLPAYSGKLGVDLCSDQLDDKTGWEKKTLSDDNINRFQAFIDSQKLLLNSNIEKVSDSFPVLFCHVKKAGFDTYIRMFEELTTGSYKIKIKVVALFDMEIAWDNYEALLWVILANIDPQRDMKIMYDNEGNSFLLINATRKNMDYDAFQRDWPNPVLSETETIASVNKRWDELGLGKRIPSPSLKYLDLMNGSGAISK